MNKSQDFLELLAHAIESEIQSRTRTELPSLCDSLQLPESPNDPNLSKRQYIFSRVGKLKTDFARTQLVATKFIEQFPISSGNEKSFQLEEILWNGSSYPIISLRVRRELARGLNKRDILIDPDGLLNALDRLWVLETRHEKVSAMISEITGDLFGQRPLLNIQNKGSLKDQIVCNFIAESGPWSNLTHGQ